MLAKSKRGHEIVRQDGFCREEEFPCIATGFCTEHLSIRTHAVKDVRFFSGKLGLVRFNCVDILIDRITNVIREAWQLAVCCKRFICKAKIQLSGYDVPF